MTITDPKVGGWALRERLLSSQMNNIRSELLKCVDGSGGGIYTLTSELEFAGSDFVIAATFRVDATGLVRLVSGAAMDVESGATFDLGGTMTVENAANLNVASGGAINVQSGGSIEVENGGEVDVASGGDILIRSGAQVNCFAGGQIDLSGLLEVQSGGIIDLLTGAAMDVQSGAEIDLQSGGDILMRSGSQINCQAGAQIDISGTASVLSGGTIAVASGGDIDGADGSEILPHHSEDVRITDTRTSTLRHAMGPAMIQTLSGVPSWGSFGNANWQQLDVSSAAAIYFPLLLVPGDVIDQIAVRVVGAGGHAGLPGTMPIVDVMHVTTTGTVTIVDTQTDTSVSAAAYDVTHFITCGSIAHTIGDEAYYIRVRGEAGANSLAGLTIQGITGNVEQHFYRNVMDKL